MLVLVCRRIDICLFARKMRLFFSTNSRRRPTGIPSEAPGCVIRFSKYDSFKNTFVVRATCCFSLVVSLVSRLRCAHFGGVHVQISDVSEYSQRLEDVPSSVLCQSQYNIWTNSSRRPVTGGNGWMPLGNKEK